MRIFPYSIMLKCSAVAATRFAMHCGLAASLLLLTGGCETKLSTSNEVEGNASERSSIDRVTAGPPVRKTLKLYTEQPGRVEAFEQAPVLSKIPGYVDAVYFDIGDKVAKGETLLRIHAPEYQAQVEQKRGLLGQAEAQVKQAEAAQAAAIASANSAKAMIVQAEASVGRVQAEYERWNSENQRIQQLVSKGSVTPKLADEAASQFKAAEAAMQETRATIESVRAKLQEAEANVNTARADVDAAKAKLKVAQADILQAETMLAYTELIAPFDGYVISRNVDSGHYVQPAGSNNAEPLMTIANVSKVRVFVNVPESEAVWVDAGMGDSASGDLVTISMASAGATPVDARVTRTSLRLDPESRSLATEIDLENSELKLLPGAFVTAKILLEQRDEVLTVPVTAIIKDAGQVRCCVVIAGKIQFQPIELGLRVGSEVEVLSGLDGQEQIVLVRADGLQPNQPVEIISVK